MRINALWRSGSGGDAVNLIEQELAAGNSELSFLTAAAEAMLAEHRYERAAELYEQLGRVHANDPQRFLDAKVHEWRARYQLSAEDSRAEWIVNERRRIQTSLGSPSALPTAGAGIFPAPTGDKAVPRLHDPQLLLELSFCLDEETGNRPTLPRELLERFPHSSVALRLAAAEVSELGTINNDRKRIADCQAFLKNWPGTYWRHVAYRFWLYSAWRLHDRPELSKAAEQYLAEYSGTAECHGAVSRYMLDLDMPVDVGLNHARKSVELYELELGISGDLNSISTVHDHSKRLAAQLPFLPPAERQTFISYLFSRHNLARYMNRQNNYDMALNLLTPVIGVEPFLPSEEETLAPFLLEAGNAQLGKENLESAYRFFLHAAFIGDSSDRYGGQAAEKLDLLKNKVSAEVQQYETSRLLPSVEDVSTIPVFSDVSYSTGVHKSSATRITWFDADADNAPDILLDGSILLKNELGRFRDRTSESGLQKHAAGAVAGDLDNDGDTDLYCFGRFREPDRAYINVGGMFNIVSGSQSDSRDSQAAAMVDLNRDGLLDVYVANLESSSGIRNESDVILLNEGTAGFSVREADSMGMAPPLGEVLAGRGVCAGDIDNDGLTDIYVSNYRLGENLLFGGTSSGSYRSMGRKLGMAGFWKDGNWGNSLGSALGDLDNDGDLDLFVANLTHPRYSHLSDGSMLLINNLSEGGGFENRTEESGIHFAATHACPVIFDANNDGWQDIFLTSIYPGRNSYLYVNDGYGHFIDLSFASNSRVQNAYGAAVADYDNDGDLDIAIASPNGCRLLRNDSPPRNWLSFLVSGGQGTGVAAPAGKIFSNRSAVGTRLTLRDGTTTIMRELQSGTAGGCGNELRVFFGLGEIRGPFEVEVLYPSGIVQTIYIRRPNKHFMISETDLASSADGEVSVNEAVIEKDAPEARLQRPSR
jgi:hypothetical protein